MKRFIAALALWLFASGAYATTLVVLSQAMGNTNSSYAGCNTRQVFPTSSLDNSYTGNGGIIIKIQSQSATSACTVTAYVGEQKASGSPFVDFDGNQVQILFSGASSLLLPNGAATTTSDQSATFNYLGNARPLTIAMYFTGTNCQAASATTRNSTTNNYCCPSNCTTDETASTSPAGTWTQDALGPAWIAEVDLVETPATTSGSGFPSTAPKAHVLFDGLHG